MVNDSYYIIYTIFFVLIFIIIEALEGKKFSRKQFCIFFAVILLFGLGLRHIDQGLRDTRVVYKSLFEVVSNYSFTDLIGTSYSKDTSIIFVWLVKLVEVLSFGEFRIFMFAMAALFIFPIEYMIYKKCDNIMLANLFFVIFLYPYGFYIIRQCVSIGLVALAMGILPQKFVRRSKKELVIALSASIFAVLIHPICILFYGVVILFYFANRVKKMDVVNIAIIIITILILITPALFTFVFNYLPQDSKYSNFIKTNHYLSGELWIGAFALYIFLGVYVFIRYKNSNSMNKTLVGFCLCASMFVATTNIVQDLVRIAFFFFPAEMVLLSKKETFRIGKYKKFMEVATKFLIYIYCFFVILPQSNIIRW